MLKHNPLTLVCLLILGGCSYTIERKTIKTTIQENDKISQITEESNPVGFFTNPDKIAAIFAKENSLNLAASIEKLDSNLGIEYKEKVVALAETLDQVNSQLYGQLQVAAFAINANPSNEKNIENFWQSYNALSKTTIKARQVSIVPLLIGNITEKRKEFDSINKVLWNFIDGLNEKLYDPNYLKDSVWWQENKEQIKMSLTFIPKQDDERKVVFLLFSSSFDSIKRLANSYQENNETELTDLLNILKRGSDTLNQIQQAEKALDVALESFSNTN